MIIFSKIFLNFTKIYKHILMFILRPLFFKYGKNFIFDPYGHYTYKTISIGDDVFVNKNAFFSSSDSFLQIGNKVMFGPNVTIICGDHNHSVHGRFMSDVKDKKKGDDQPVIISDDVWIGAGATILKGVTVGRGAIIGANSLVLHDILPYSINVGSPAKLLRFRMNLEEVLDHESVLYEEEKRLSRDYLIKIYSTIEN